jgi:hypothetical protein
VRSMHQAHARPTGCDKILRIFLIASRWYAAVVFYPGPCGERLNPDNLQLVHTEEDSHYGLNKYW